MKKVPSSTAASAESHLFFIVFGCLLSQTGQLMVRVTPKSGSQPQQIVSTAQLAPKQWAFVTMRCVSSVVV